MIKETPLNFMSCEKYLLFMIKRFDKVIQENKIGAVELKSLTDELNRFKYRVKESILSEDLKSSILEVSFDFEEIEKYSKGWRVFFNIITFGIYGSKTKSNKNKRRLHHLDVIKKKFYDLLAQIQHDQNVDEEVLAI